MILFNNIFLGVVVHTEFEPWYFNTYFHTYNAFNAIIVYGHTLVYCSFGLRWRPQIHVRMMKCVLPQAASSSSFLTCRCMWDILIRSSIKHYASAASLLHQPFRLHSTAKINLFLFLIFHMTQYCPNNLFEMSRIFPTDFRRTCSNLRSVTKQM